jgi:hypothetical protein
MLQKRDERIETHLYLQTKYREVQAQFAKLRHHYLFEVQKQLANLRHLYLLIECAWCQRRIGWKRKMAAVPSDTSHGICPSCATVLFRKIQAMKDSQAGASSLTPQNVA